MTEPQAVRRRRLFDAESANRALPYIRAIADDIAAAFARVAEAESSRGRGRGAPVPPAERGSRRTAEERAVAARVELARLLAELGKAGVELKDPATGLLDFPAEIEGRPVFLCWKRGEERVAWFHDREGPNAGFPARRPIPGIEPPAAEPPAPIAPGVDPDAAPAGPADSAPPVPPPSARRRAR